MINLFTNYGLIALIFILLKVFVILSNTTFKSDIPLSAKLIIFLVLAIGTIDGPDEIKNYLAWTQVFEMVIERLWQVWLEWLLPVKLEVK